MSPLGNPEIGGSKGLRTAPSVHPPHRTAQSGSGGIPTILNVSTKLLTAEQVAGDIDRFRSRVMPICRRRNSIVGVFSAIPHIRFGQMAMCPWWWQIQAWLNESGGFDVNS